MHGDRKIWHWRCWRHKANLKVYKGDITLDKNLMWLSVSLFVYTNNALQSVIKIFIRFWIYNELEKKSHLPLYALRVLSHGCIIFMQFTFWWVHLLPHICYCFLNITIRQKYKHTIAWMGCTKSQYSSTSIRKIKKGT